MEKEEKKAEKKKGQSEGVRRGRTRINKKIVCNGCIRIDANISHMHSINMLLFKRHIWTNSALRGAKSLYGTLITLIKR